MRVCVCVFVCVCVCVLCVCVCCSTKNNRRLFPSTRSSLRSAHLASSGLGAPNVSTGDHGGGHLSGSLRQSVSSSLTTQQQQLHLPASSRASFSREHVCARASFSLERMCTRVLVLSTAGRGRCADSPARCLDAVSTGGHLPRRTSVQLASSGAAALPQAENIRLSCGFTRRRSLAFGLSAYAAHTQFADTAAHLPRLLLLCIRYSNDGVI